MKITYQDPDYCAEKIRKRFVKRVRNLSSGAISYAWEEVNATGLTLRLGFVEPDEVPEDVRANANAQHAIYPQYVTWPFEA